MAEQLSVIVTGSTSGIGMGVAHSFAKAGHKVAINGRRLNEAAEAAMKEFTDAYGAENIVFAGADISKPDQVDAMVETTVKAFGKVDVLVQNAGIQHTAPVVDFPADKWEQIISVNLSSVFYGAKAVLPMMLKQGYGRIINIASVHGLIASKEKAAYVAAKHGVIGLTKVMALETAEAPVTCNCICPGWVLTPLVAKQIEARAAENGATFEHEKMALLSEKQPSKEFTTPGQLGDLAVFLSTDSASQLTGQAISMDGGWTAQ